MAEDGLEGGVEAQEARAGDASGDAGGADACAEEAFVGIDVADSVEKLLVEERGFDGELAALEERAEGIRRDGEGFAAWALEWLGVFEGVEAEATEATGVNEAEFVAGAEGEAGVGVRRNGDVGVGVEQAAGHAEVDEELVGGGLAAEGFEVEDDVFADAMDAGDAEPGESSGHGFGVGLEGLAGSAEGGGEDALAMGSVMDALGYGFDFWEFGHGVDLVSHCVGWVGDRRMVRKCEKRINCHTEYRAVYEAHTGGCFSMQLTTEQMNKVLTHLGHYAAPECVICHHDDWAVADTVFVLPEYRVDPSYSTTQTAFPAITITCKVCGNVLFLSAIAAGVVSGSIVPNSGKDLEK